VDPLDLGYQIDTGQHRQWYAASTNVQWLGLCDVNRLSMPKHIGKSCNQSGSAFLDQTSAIVDDLSMSADIERRISHRLVKQNGGLAAGMRIAEFVHDVGIATGKIGDYDVSSIYRGQDLFCDFARLLDVVGSLAVNVESGCIGPARVLDDHVDVIELGCEWHQHEYPGSSDLHQ
jgi:hypothetical protein